MKQSYHREVPHVFSYDAILVFLSRSTYSREMEEMHHCSIDVNQHPFLINNEVAEIDLFQSVSMRSCFTILLMKYYSY